MAAGAGAGIGGLLTLKSSNDEIGAMRENAKELERRAKEVMALAEINKSRRKEEALLLRGMQQNSFGTLDDATRSIIEQESSGRAIDDLIEIQRVASLEAESINFEANQSRNKADQQSRLQPLLVASSVLGGAAAGGAFRGSPGTRKTSAKVASDSGGGESSYFSRGQQTKVPM